MICPRCGTIVASGKKFCGDCGSLLPWQCTACGSENAAGKRFCGDCGAASSAALVESRQPMSSSPASPVAERRQLTVMFADLVGSTGLSTKLDPEDLREVIASYHGCVNGLVAHFGGFVARYLGDGVLVYFGYPHAQEDDPERSVRAGLAIVEAVRGLGTIAGPPGTLGARVGIATGLVVVGDVIGSGSSLESPVVGETPNLAARLQGLAEPGAVVIADATRKLTGELFEYRELAPANLKGLPGPVRVFAVTAEKRIDSRFEALHAGHLPLVGRTEELDLLLRRWEQAKRGAGRVVLLSGEAGIGKSRLIAALEERVGKTARVRRYLCWPHYQDTALYPVIRQIERVVAFERGDSPAAKTEKFQRYLAGGPWSPTDVALFADLLSIPVAHGHLIEGLSPQRKKELTFEAMVRFFASLGGKGRVLAVLEDIHWADPTTLDLLDLVVEKVAELPMLLVVSTRPDTLPSWATRAHVSLQLLNALPRAQALTLITKVADATALSDQVVKQIIRHADGVPLFIEELTKTVLDSETARKAEGDVSTMGPLSADLLPATLQATLMARLDRIGAGKEIAQIGSVIGREFSFEMVQILSGLPEVQLEDALGELVRAELTIPRGAPPNAVYTFKHALVQDAAYASMLRARRRAIHLRLAEHLENDTTAGTPPQLIAWHFAQAGVPDKSIDYYLKAAQGTTGRFALAEMVGHLREGLRQLDPLPSTQATRSRELALHVALGRALIDHRGASGEEVRQTFERARDLCLELGETKHLLRVHDGLVNYHLTQLELKRVLHYAGEILDVGRKTGEPQAFVMAHRSAGIANMLLGRFEEARHEFELFADVYETTRDGPHAALAIRDPKVSVCTSLGICLTVMGFPELGAAAGLEGVSHAESLNHMISLTLGLRRACVERILQRDTAGVIARSKRLLELSGEYETFKGSLDGTIFQCWGQLQTGRDAAQLGEMLKCIDQLDAGKNWVLLPFLMACASEIKAEHGDLDGARMLIERAAELTKLTNEQWCEPEITRLRARFSARSPEEAEILLQASLATAKEQGARLWELRSATNLAALWRDRERRADAVALLDGIYAQFTEGFDIPDMVAVRIMLEQLRH